MSECLLPHVFRVLDTPDGGFSRMVSSVASHYCSSPGSMSDDMEITLSLGMYQYGNCVESAIYECLSCAIVFREQARESITLTDSVTLATPIHSFIRTLA